jgi:hypothetical protein
MMNMVEGLLAPDDIPAYAAVLLDKVKTDRVPELLHTPPVNQPFLIAGLVRGRTPALILSGPACSLGGVH